MTTKHRKKRVAPKLVVKAAKVLKVKPEEVVQPAAAPWVDPKLKWRDDPPVEPRPYSDVGVAPDYPEDQEARSPYRQAQARLHEPVAEAGTGKAALLGIAIIIAIVLGSWFFAYYDTAPEPPVTTATTPEATATSTSAPTSGKQSVKSTAAWNKPTAAPTVEAEKYSEPDDGD